MERKIIIQLYAKTTLQKWQLLSLKEDCFDRNRILDLNFLCKILESISTVFKVSDPDVVLNQQENKLTSPQSDRILWTEWLNEEVCHQRKELSARIHKKAMTYLHH